jgi:quercetin dioxygenase-like cupin family protein
MTNDAASVISLTEAVAFQDGAVVSRELLSKPVGTISLFAFDAGQGLSEHTAPFDATVVCLEGELEIEIAGQSNLLAAGDLLIMPAGRPHALRARTRVKMMLVMIRA